MKMLTSAGIDILILQDIAETTGGKVDTVGFDSQYSRDHAADNFVPHDTMLRDALTAAKANGVKIFVGSNFSGEWWSNAFVDANWRAEQAAIGNALAQEIYDQYKPEFGDTLYGWYWTWEMYNNIYDTSACNAAWSDMMNQNLDYYHGLDTKMPVLFSPFLSAWVGGTPEQTRAQWAEFIGMTDFRAGDIFVPQDSYGGGSFELSYVGDSLAAMKAAADTKPGLEYWVNVETFDANFQSASIERLVSQMDVAAKYADHLISFSYSHYYNPLLSEAQAELDREYKEYLQGKKY